MSQAASVLLIQKTKQNSQALYRLGIWDFVTNLVASERKSEASINVGWCVWEITERVRKREKKWNLSHQEERVVCEWERRDREHFTDLKLSFFSDYGSRASPPFGFKLVQSTTMFFLWKLSSYWIVLRWFYPKPSLICALIYKNVSDYLLMTALVKLSLFMHRRKLFI